MTAVNKIFIIISMSSSPKHAYGYYLFLGTGDFPPPEPLTNQWTSTWTFEDWKQNILTLRDAGMNTLFLYLMGNTLPFTSENYPQCIETGHPNVETDFCQEVIDFCNSLAIDVIGVFSTTGHAQGFTLSYPHTAVINRDGIQQPESGISCHHHPEAQTYARTVITELLHRYHGFKGIMLHPPEFLEPCYCSRCREKYRSLYNENLAAMDNQNVQRFFMETNLEFQNSVIVPRVREITGNTQLFTFTIPWVFENDFEIFARRIPEDTILVEWDYDLRDETISSIPARLDRYRQFGHTLWFMPSAGFNFYPGTPFHFTKEKTVEEQAAQVLKQIETVVNQGIHDIIYFVGPYIPPTLKQTSRYIA